MQTGRIISEMTGAPLTIDTRLREMDFGDWEGKTKQDLHAAKDKHYQAWVEDPVGAAPPNSEPPQAVADRMLDFLSDYRNNSADAAVLGDIAVVTSSTSLRLLLTQLNGQSLSSYRENKTENASITTILIEDGGRVSVDNSNYVEHLR